MNQMEITPFLFLQENTDLTRGNQRTQGDRSRQEGGKIFGQGSRAPVAITILVRNPDADHSGCRIFYRDIGDYLKREEKLAILKDAGSINGIHDWRRITPDKHHDWISQRDETFQAFNPMGSKEAKAGRADDAIFKLYSRGFETTRDAYLYNFSRDACTKNAQAMVSDYMGAMHVLEAGAKYSVEHAAKKYSTNIRWNPELKRRLRQGVATKFSSDYVQLAPYRPFVKQHLYADYIFIHRLGQSRTIFPEPDSENRAICIPGVGSTKPFSVLMVNSMPDLHFVAFGQCFPRYRYQKPPKTQRLLPGYNQGLERIDNISDTALRAFRVHYSDNTITKDDIFEYIYGILHAPDYRKRFANDLSKELPRIPFAPDFWVFTKAGRELAEIHLGYETCDEYPIEREFSGNGEPKAKHFKIGTKYMKFADPERSVLIVNDHIRLANIPPEAHHYVVNGRTPLEWFIDRYRIKTDGRSGILNDPNGWFDAPRDLITAFRRIVHVSVESTRIVGDLPKSL